MLQKLIPLDWANLLKKDFNKEYFLKLDKFICESYENFTIYPPKDLIFEAFKITPYKNIKVVILGQDPYHGENQSQGLCFSVPENQKIPPSLRNVFKELSNDLDINRNSKNLTDWANQGILLINNVLTVEKNKAGSHRNNGWEIFTESIFKILNNYPEPIIFILWGNDAIKKEKLITETKHLILKAPHPSPLSSYRGFFNSKPFSKTNNFLIKNNRSPISW